MTNLRIIKAVPQKRERAVDVLDAARDSVSKSPYCIIFYDIDDCMAIRKSSNITRADLVFMLQSAIMGLCNPASDD